MERRGDQRLARRTLTGPTKPAKVRSAPVPNPSTTHQNIALGSTLRRRRIAPLSRAKRSISAFGNKLVNVSRIPINLTRDTAIPLIG